MFEASPPLIVATIACSALQAVVYGYLARQRQEAWLGLLALAWSLFACRYGLILADEWLWPPYSPLVVLFERGLDLVAAVLLVVGFARLAGQTAPPWPWPWPWLAGGVGLWLVTATGAILDWPRVWFALPITLFQAAALGWSGLLLLRCAKGRVYATLRIAGVILILWALHKLDYPLVLLNPHWQVWGYMGLLLFMIANALVILVFYFEQADELVRRQEQCYRERFDGSVAMVLLIEPERGVIVDANRAAIDFYGYPAEQLRGLPFSQLRAPDTEDDRSALDQTLAHQHFCECRHRLASGAVRDIELHIGPVLQDERTLLGAVLHDVTERKAAQRQARQLSQAVNQSPASVLITDLDGRIEYVNPQFEATTGWRAAEVQGRTPALLKSGQMPAAIYRELWQVITGGDVWRGEFCNAKKNGEHFWVVASISPVKDEQGVVTHFVAVEEDITRRKAMEAELIAARNAAEQANHAKSAFLATISHELRTPLNAIIGFSELIRDDPALAGDPEGSHQYAATILDAGHHLLRLVNDIIEVTKIEAGDVPITLEPVEVGPLAMATLGKAAAAAGEAGLTLQLVQPSEVPPLWADKLALNQMLDQLMSNALKFTPAGGTVRLIVRPAPQGGTEVAVADSGCGIPEEQLGSVLKPFYQVGDVLRRTSEGAGLGLTIVVGLAKLQGATVSIRSTTGQGTTVSLLFPPRPGA